MHAFVAILCCIRLALAILVVLILFAFAGRIAIGS